jgi:hypothetical protein
MTRCWCQIDWCGQCDGKMLIVSKGLLASGRVTLMVASRDGTINRHVREHLRFTYWSESWVGSSSIVDRLASSISGQSKLEVVVLSLLHRHLQKQAHVNFRMDGCELYLSLKFVRPLRQQAQTSRPRRFSPSSRAQPQAVGTHGSSGEDQDRNPASSARRPSSAASRGIWRRRAHSPSPPTRGSTVESP